MGYNQQWGHEISAMLRILGGGVKHCIITAQNCAAFALELGKTE